MRSSLSVLDRRRAGVLLHITSLPSSIGNGDLGHEAYRFIEFLAKNGVTVWQTLPLGPTHEDGSPYQCLSAHAGNPLLISLEWLVDQGWLQQPEEPLPWKSMAYRRCCLVCAYEGFIEKADSEQKQTYQEFCKNHAEWLNDFALFIALRQSFENRCWMDWPTPLRDRHPDAIHEAIQYFNSAIEQVKFEQFVFFTQWAELKWYANRYNVLMFGDMPIFVAGDSADVWANREQFLLDKKGQPTVVAGVPPDYFSETGQRWGNPHYDWDAMGADRFNWWIERIKTQLELFDWVRIDHFRGLEAYWEIPADSETAINGQWVTAPGEALLNAIYAHFESLPLIAENLGIITPEVEALRLKFDIPGMVILQFAFDGGSENTYLPHNHNPNSVVYTGTHDNDTTLSWYNSLSEEQQNNIKDYLGRESVRMPLSLVRVALASVAQLAIIPMQDVLGLGGEHRMNTPGTTEGNWGWRLSWDQVDEENISLLAHFIQLYGR
ncbi:MAG: 4-alpha-glucanotransferase [Methylococcales bacterium]